MSSGNVVSQIFSFALLFDEESEAQISCGDFRGRKKKDGNFFHFFFIILSKHGEKNHGKDLERYDEKRSVLSTILRG